MMPSSLPSSYVRFLNKAAAKEPWVWKAVQVSVEGCAIEMGGLSIFIAPSTKPHIIIIININYVSRSKPCETGTALALAV